MILIFVVLFFFAISPLPLPFSPLSLNQVIVLTLTSVLPWHVPWGLIAACHLLTEINFSFRCLSFSFLFAKESLRMSWSATPENDPAQRHAVTCFPSSLPLCFQGMAFSLLMGPADTWPLPAETMRMTAGLERLQLQLWWQIIRNCHEAVCPAALRASERRKNGHSLQIQTEMMMSTEPHFTYI